MSLRLLVSLEVNVDVLGSKWNNTERGKHCYDARMWPLRVIAVTHRIKRLSEILRLSGKESRGLE